MIGTRKRRQCSQAAGRDRPRQAERAGRACGLFVERRRRRIRTRRSPAVANTPPTKASSSRIEGRAIRRLAVKNRASAQAVAATSSGPRKDGPSLDDEPVRLADPLADPADREQQDRGGDRDEDVVEAGDEPEILFVDRGEARWLVDEGAKRCGGLGADRARSHGLVEVVLAVHGQYPP